MVERDPWAPTRRFFEALNELREAESLHLEGCYLPGDHDGDCRLCAVCIVCGVEKGCRKPCCNMGNKVCAGDPDDIGDHIWSVPRREAKEA